VQDHSLKRIELLNVRLTCLSGAAAPTSLVTLSVSSGPNLIPASDSPGKQEVQTPQQQMQPGGREAYVEFFLLRFLTTGSAHQQYSRRGTGTRSWMVIYRQQLTPVARNFTRPSPSGTLARARLTHRPLSPLRPAQPEKAAGCPRGALADSRSLARASLHRQAKWRAASGSVPARASAVPRRAQCQPRPVPPCGRPCARRRPPWATGEPDDGRCRLARRATGRPAGGPALAGARLGHWQLQRVNRRAR
jgi:hypothetical protein